MICHICERAIASGGMYVPGDPPRHLGCGRKARIGDMVPVLIEAGDGPTVVWHTPREYADLWDGVDELAAEVLGEGHG